MNVSLSLKSILHMREQVLVTETTNGGIRLGASCRQVLPESPIFARKQHYIAHFQSKLSGTYAFVWVGRWYPEKGAYMCI